MGKKNKQKKFDDIDSFANVYQQTHWDSDLLRNNTDEKLVMRGKWGEHFGNDKPIVLELACGYGEYSIGMAQANKDCNYIGIDVKGNRVWMGAKAALEQELSNVAFLRGRIENLARFFEKEEVAEIWITFPDPFLPERRFSRRLTYTRFQEIYKTILQPGGFVQLKTDCEPLYQFSLLMMEKNNCKIIVNNDDIYGNGFEEEFLKIRTRYENKHLAFGASIKYLKWQY